VIFVKTPEMVYAIFLAFLLANLLLIPLGWMVINLARHILRVPRSVILPAVLASCIIGAFAINNTAFGVGVMLVFGVIGWIFERSDIPVAPAILGIVLGGMVEFNFVTTMLKSQGDVLGLVDRPIAAILALAVAGLWLTPVLKALLRRRAP
ncbi:MAG: tripartite tricarboxylate transporter permease, partial [Pseudomonadota bacterium]